MTRATPRRVGRVGRNHYQSRLFYGPHHEQMLGIRQDDVVTFSRHFFYPTHVHSPQQHPKVEQVSHNLGGPSTATEGRSRNSEHSPLRASLTRLNNFLDIIFPNQFRNKALVSLDIMDSRPYQYKPRISDARISPPVPFSIFLAIPTVACLLFLLTNRQIVGWCIPFACAKVVTLSP